MSEWQPIETAPKDGTSVIVYNGKYVTEACWLDQPDDDGHTGWCESGFCFGGILYDLHNEMDDDPTHWMPLPKPPESDK